MINATVFVSSFMGTFSAILFAIVLLLMIKDLIVSKIKEMFSFNLFGDMKDDK